MGPAFSLALLLIIGLGSLAITYGVAKLFVSGRGAAAIAIGFLVGAAFGALLTIIATWLFGAQEELKSSSQVAVFFSQLAVSATVFGAIFASVAYRRLIPK
jgi:hypothetical protein